MSGLTGRARLVLLVFALLAWFGTLDYRRLVKPDEGRYAEIPREMVASGDWLTPRLNGIKYFEKPPLQYWTTAAAYKLFGLHAWTARLWTALAGFLTIVLVWWAGRRLLTPAAGDVAAMVLASNLYFVILGHVNSLDMGLTLFTTLALVGLCFAQRDDASGASRRRWMLVTWFAMGFAVLSKGLAGVVLPGLTLVAYAIVARDWLVWRRLSLWPGVLVFLLIAAPWFVAVSMAHPEFPWFFFMEQHVLRYATDVGRREGPAYYFIAVLALGMLPWTVVAAHALWAQVRRAWQRTAPQRLELLLLCWIAVVFVFFTVSRSKLPAYVLPLVPALALLTARHLTGISGRRVAALVVPVGVVAVAGGVLAGYAPQLTDDLVLRPLMESYIYWLYVAAAAAVAGIGYCGWQALAGDKLSALIGLATAGLLSSLLILNGHNSFAPSLSSYALAQQLRGVVPSDAPFYSVRTYDQTLPFYLQRTFTPVEFRDELHFGLLQEPQLAIHNFEQFRSRWLSEPRAYAVTTHEHLAMLRQAGLPVEIVAEDLRRVVVRRP